MAQQDVVSSSIGSALLLQVCPVSRQVKENPELALSDVDKLQDVIGARVNHGGSAHTISLCRHFWADAVRGCVVRER